MTGSEGEAQTLFRSPNFQPSYIFPYNPDDLCNGNNYDIYDEMKDDDQVKVCVSLKKDSVVNSGWKIVCDDKKVNDFVVDALEGINEFNGLSSTFDDCLRDILSAYEYGFSMTEPVYVLKNGKYVFKQLRTRPPHSFQFVLNDKGDVVVVEQYTNTGMKTFQPELFLHHVYQSEFGNPYGKSDLRSAYKPWKAKNFIDKFLAIYLERFATGTVVGKYDSNQFNDTEINRFHSVLKTIQNATSLAIPKGTEIEIIQSSRDSSEAYLKALAFYNMKIGRALLVPDLLGVSGDQTSGGAYSLGKEQFKVFMMAIKKDRESLSRKITQKLINPLVRVNFGNNIPCWFEFLPLSMDDVLEYMKTWSDAVQGRVWKPSEDEINYFRRVLGFPEGDVEMPEDQPVVVPDARRPFKTGHTAKQVDHSDPDQGCRCHGQRFSRPLTQYEKKVDFAEIKQALDAGEQAIQKELGASAKKIYNDLIQQIRDRGLLTKFKPEFVNDIAPKFLREMNSVLKSYFTDLFKTAFKEARIEIFPDGDKKFADNDPFMPDEFMKYLNAKSFKIVGDYGDNITKKAKNIILNSIKAGVGEGETVLLVRDEMEAETEKWIATTTRTVTTEVYNQARKSYWETDPLAKQIVEAYQWSAIMDERTSEICAELDGKIFEIGSYTDQVTPPAHFNCRSVLVPITKFEEYKTSPEIPIDEIREMGGSLIQ